MDHLLAFVSHRVLVDNSSGINFLDLAGRPNALRRLVCCFIIIPPYLFVAHNTFLILPLHAYIAHHQMNQLGSSSKGSGKQPVRNSEESEDPSDPFLALLHSQVWDEISTEASNVQGKNPDCFKTTQGSKEQGASDLEEGYESTQEVPATEDVSSPIYDSEPSDGLNQRKDSFGDANHLVCGIEEFPSPVLGYESVQEVPATEDVQSVSDSGTEHLPSPAPGYESTQEVPATEDVASVDDNNETLLGRTAPVKHIGRVSLSPPASGSGYPSKKPKLDADTPLTPPPKKSTYIHPTNQMPLPSEQSSSFSSGAHYSTLTGTTRNPKIYTKDEPTISPSEIRNVNSARGSPVSELSSPGMGSPL